MSVYYKDDLVTLYHGDCLTEHTEWTSADVLVTDPPYGIEWEGIRSRYTDKINHWTVPANAITNDSTLDVRDTAIKMWGGGKARNGVRSLEKRPTRRHKTPPRLVETRTSTRTNALAVCDAGRGDLHLGDGVGEAGLAFAVSNSDVRAKGPVCVRDRSPDAETDWAHGATPGAVPAGCGGGPFRWEWGHVDCGEESGP